MENVLEKKFELINEIAGGGMGKVFYAYDRENKRNVAIKILKKEELSRQQEDTIRFYKRTQTISRLDHPNIIKIYNVNIDPAETFLVMEYVPGISLADLLKEKKSLSAEEALSIIKQIALALIYLHSHNIIHRDIKPSNVLISPDKQVKLIDFGLARTGGPIMAKEEISGTFGYMAPEQYGAIRSFIDERSDLYSLGILFFQLLTGSMPFTGETLSSLIHQHLAKKPQSLGKLNASISVLLEKIVLKLIEKEPEMRYQSALGLLNDLTSYEKGEDLILLGDKDTCVKLNYQADLVGREDELEELTGMFRDIKKGKGGVCFIGGEAGKGKSRLVEELEKNCYEEKALFLRGKCFSGINKVPYGPFKEALTDYLRIFDTYSEEKKTKIRDFIQKETGLLGTLLTGLNPLLKEVIRESEAVPPLDVEKEPLRFLMVFKNFFKSLSLIEENLVLVLDDLQWADVGTLELLDGLCESLSEIDILIIGIFRDNEIDSRSKLRFIIEKHREQKEGFCEILLKPLDRRKTGDFISRMLFAQGKSIEEISDFIFARARGNAFFSIELLKQLVESKDIYFEDRNWKIKDSMFNAAGIPYSILDMVSKRIKLLDKNEFLLLTYAAAIGNHFSLDELFCLCDFAEKSDIIELVDKGKYLQLIESDPRDKVFMRFVHDKIKEAFYQSLNHEDRASFHNRIAQMIESRHDLVPGDTIFKLAHHYIEGQRNEKILEYAYPAGLKAKESYANKEAISYFNKVLEVLEASGKENRSLHTSCLMNKAEICLVIGKTDEATAIYNLLLKQAPDDSRKAEIYGNLAAAYHKKGDWQGCGLNAQKSLVLFKEKIPESKIHISFLVFKELVIHFFHTLAPGLFIRKGKNNEEQYAVVMGIFRRLAWVYAMDNVPKFLRLILRMLNLVERKIGVSRELGFAYSTYGVICASISFFNGSLKYHRKALNLRKELNDVWGIANSYQFMGTTLIWSGRYDMARQICRQSIDTYEKIGDMWEAGMSYLQYAYTFYYKGEYDDALCYTRKYLKISEDINDTHGIYASISFIGRIHLELGNPGIAEESLKKSREHVKKEKKWFKYCIAIINLGRVYYEQELWDKAAAILEEALKIYEENTFLKDYTVYIYPYLAECYIERYNREYLIPGLKADRVMLKKIGKCVKEALSHTKSWINHYGLALLAGAKYCVLKGNSKKAEKYFMESIGHHKKLGRRYEEARGCLEYGRFLKRLGRDSEKGDVYLNQACQIFKDLDSKLYLNRIAKLLKTKDADKKDIKHFMDKEKLASIIKVSQDISSILNIEHLLDEVMLKAIEVTGAQRGYLFMENPETRELILQTGKHIDGEEDIFPEYSKTIVNNVYKTKKSIITTNAEMEEKLDYQSVVNYKLKSIMAVPVEYRGKILGVAYLDNPLTGNVFTSEDAQLLTVFMTQAAICIENAGAYRNLTLSQQKNTALLNAIPDYMFHIDIKGDILDFKLSKDNELKLEETQLEGAHLSLIFPGNMVPFLLKNTHEAINNNSLKIVELKIPAKEQSFTFETRIVKSTRNKALIIMRNVTDARRNEELLRRQNDQLVQADKLVALGTIVAGIAHEINNPNNSIMLTSGILEKTWKSILPVLDEYVEDKGDFPVGNSSYSILRDETADSLTRILENSGRIKTIVNDLKNFSRKGEGNTALPVDINNVVKTAIRLLEPIIKKRTIHFSVNLGKGLPLIMGKSQQLEQVLVNLIQNACQSLENKSAALSVETSLSSDGRISISVKDEGSGIDDESLKRIFEPFFTTKYSTGGTGLGLYISKKLIQDHRGELIIRSTAGEGTGVEILLPAIEG